MPKALYIVDAGDFVRTAARVLQSELGAALDEAALRSRSPSRADISVCLSGGSTPRPVYAALVADAPARFPWRRVHLWLGDERWVGADDERSNARLVRETILRAPGMDEGSLRRVDTLREDPDVAASEYAKELPADAVFDLMVLGVGADGHTASIFPYSAAARERRRLVVHSVAPVEPVHRVSITLPVITKARRLVTLVRGAGKAAAVAAAIEGNVSREDCPARVARDGIWVLDTEAAAALGDC